MRFIIASLLVMMTVALSSQESSAQVFRIINRSGTAGDPFNTACNVIESNVNSTYLSETSRRAFLGAMADASVSGTHGINADYGSNPSIFVVGFGLGAGFDLNGSSMSNAFSSTTNSLPPAGANIQTSILLGINASKARFPELFGLDPKRMMFYFNAMSLSTTKDSVAASQFNIGLHAQYQLIEGKGMRAVAYWNGINVLTGFDYSTLSASYSSTLSETSGALNVVLPYTIGVKSKYFAIPVEVSTSASLLYILSLYVGAGGAFGFGSADTEGNSSGPVTGIGTGTATVNLSDTGVNEKPGAVSLYGFAGLQFNLWVLKIGGQGQAFSNGATGGSAFVRIAL